MTKADSQKAHTQKRALERYGLLLCDRTQEAIVQDIQHQAPHVTFLHRQSKRVSHWAVELGGMIVRVVYDNKRHSLVTVLPPGT